MTITHIDPGLYYGSVGQRLTIPTHVSPAGGEATHPSVVFFDEEWNGYHYWMLITPFPSANEAHEDPNLLVSNDGTKWEFAPGAPLPLDDEPGGASYNSDVCLAVKDDTLYAFWRTVSVANNVTTETYWCRASDDGVTWTPKEKFFESSGSGTKYLSPSIFWDGDNWVAYVVNMQTSPNTVERWERADSSEWINVQVCTGVTMQPGKEPWHIEVRKIADQYLMLVADIKLGHDVAVDADLVLLSSKDGVAWTSAGRPLIPRNQTGEHNRLYKSTFLPSVRNGMHGFDVWYGGILSSTNTWRLYKTWVGPNHKNTIRMAQSGFSTYYGVINGNSGVNGVSVDFNFPEPFPEVPIVVITLDNTVVHGTVIARSVTGFRVRIENYTPTTAGNIGIQWFASVLN